MSIIVHLGVSLRGGSYGQRHLLECNEDLCEKVCEKACQCLSEGGRAEDAVRLAIADIELDPSTNAGVGSALNLNGHVECDACIMNEQLFGCVGAVPRFKQPINIAYSLLRKQSFGLLTGGRIAPSFLVGEGALLWATEHGMASTSPDHLLTRNTVRQYGRHRKSVPEGAETLSSILHDCMMDREVRLDTIGAIAIDTDARVAAGVSSGGLSLKFPGRCGQAAVYGSGCWAERLSSHDLVIASSCSGTGELLIKTHFAKEFANEYAHEAHDLRGFVEKKFIEVNHPLPSTERYVGVIALKSCRDRVRLVAVHNTPSFFIAYRTLKGNETVTRNLSLFDEDLTHVNVEHFLI